ncbi:MAG: histidine--tRNA ligase, partial [Spirochaetaceae bacterium]|nr:histidine--tRNA ligase [Spirochaetaceae bacterium]
MAELIEPRLLKGFRDFLPRDERERRRIEQILGQTFAAFGFEPIDTPILEYTEILLGKGGGETDKQIYRFEDQGDRDVAMRYDLTVPFARFMALHLHELPLPFKRFHIAKVFRGENTQRGRYREFVQCDFDIVGSDSASADFEIVLLMDRSFRAIGVDDIRIHLSHRGVFNSLLAHLGMTDRGEQVLRIVDKMRKIGETGVRAQLEEIAGAAATDTIMTYITRGSDNESTLESMRTLAPDAEEDLRRLSEVLQAAKSVGIVDRIVLDPSITRGLDYYTGIVFETFLTALPEIGSVCSGGRYNNLAGLYTKERLPGVGTSIGLDRLMAGLEE